MKQRFTANEMVSFLLMPQISSIYPFTLLVLATGASIFHFAICILFTSLIQIVSMFVYVIKSGDDFNVPKRENRLLLFVVAIISYFTAFFILKYTFAPFIITALMLCYALNTIVATLITHYLTKVSIHVWGISGPSVAVYYSYGVIGFVLMLILAGIAGVARINSEKHTLKQVVLSFVLSIPITAIIIYILAPRVI